MIATQIHLAFLTVCACVREVCGRACVSMFACAFTAERHLVRVLSQKRCFVEVEWPFKPLNLTVKKQTGIGGLI